MQKKLSVAQYFKIAKVGDIVETNGNHSHANSEVYKGKVLAISDVGIELRDLNDNATTWKVYKEANADVYFIVEKKDGDAVKPKPVKTAVLSIESKTMPGGNLAFIITVPKEVEEFYKNASGGATQQSQNWKDANGVGVNFYLIPDTTRKMEKKVNSYNFSDFGNGLLNGDSINTGLLRCVGASKGITVTGEGFGFVTNVEMEFYAKRLGEFVKGLWQIAISPQELKAVITFEI